MLQHIIPSRANLLTETINKNITPVKITFSNRVVREWSPTLFTTVRAKTNSLKGAQEKKKKSHAHTLRLVRANNNNNVWRSTGRAACQAHKQGVSRSLCEKKSQRKRASERWCESIIEWQRKSKATPTTPQSQVNWIIGRKKGRYHLHLLQITHKTTSMWLRRGPASEGKALL